MMGWPDTVAVDGTDLELIHNSRVFDVVVSKAGQCPDLQLAVTAHSFTQAASAAITEANKIRDLLVKQSGEGSETLPHALQTPFSPADVRSMIVVRSGVRNFLHASVVSTI